MKPEDIINSLGEISDSLLLQAEIPVRRRSLRKILSLSAAAVLLVCAFTVPLVLERYNGVAPPVSVPSGVFNDDEIKGNRPSDSASADGVSTPDYSFGSSSNTPSDALDSSIGGSSDTSADASSGDLGDVSNDFSNDFSDAVSSGDNSNNNTGTDISVPDGNPTVPDNGNTSSPDYEIEDPTILSPTEPEDITINMTFVAGLTYGDVNGGGEDDASTEIWDDESSADVGDDSASSAPLKDKTLSDADSETLLVMFAELMLYNEKLYPPTFPTEGPENGIERQNACASALGYERVYWCMFVSDIDNIKVYFYRSKTDDGYLMVKNMNFYAVSNEEYNQIIGFINSAPEDE